MPDLSALSSIASTALPATLTFLYQRLEKLLDRRSSDPEHEVDVPQELVGDLELPLQVEEAALKEHRFTLETLRDALDQYYRGNAPIEANDERLLRQMGRLRGILEELYSQNLTFIGEQRAPSGPHVRQNIDTVTGEVRGMDADEISGKAAVSQEVGRVENGSTLIGMRARRIGTPPPPQS